MSTIRPPQWADRFLQWYCNPDLLEEIQGDAYELFYDRLKHRGKRRARWSFAWDVLRFLRWSNIKRSNTQNNTLNNTIMIGNYFKTGYRNLLKNRVTAGINIIGLSLAIGCAITTFIFVDFFVSMDNFHKNKENIYQLINHVNTHGEEQMWSDVPILLGPEMEDKIPFLDQSVRIEYASGNLRHDDLVFQEFVWFVDPAFTEMFDFPIAEGGRKVLYNKEQIFLSQPTAIKYFGGKDPIGKQVSIKYDNGVIQSYFVGGVFDKYPENTGFAPSVLVAIDNFFDAKFQENYDWSYKTDGLFVSLKEGYAPAELEKFFGSWIGLQNQADPDFKTIGLEPMRLDKISEKNYLISGSIIGGGHPAGRISLCVVSALLILLACSNYVNISVASATKRLKEIALRKVMGSDRSAIVRQFLLENLLTCFLAIILGTGLAYFFFLPGFNSVIPITIPFSFHSVLTMAVFFLGLLAVIGIISGAYPALYISRFQPVAIFSGSQKFGQKSAFSKVLLTFQFIIAFSTIVGSFIFTDTSLRLAHRDWGYSPEGIVAVPVNTSDQYEGLKNEMIQDSNVKLVAGSHGQIGMYDQLVPVTQGTANMQAAFYQTSGSYQELMGLRLVKGRYIKEGSDVQKAVINERFAQKMGWPEPLKQFFAYDSVRYDVVGVVGDFVTNNYWTEVSPAFFVSGKEEDYNYLLVKTNQAHEAGVYKRLLEQWKAISPDDPFEGRFQSEALDNFYQENTANIALTVFLSALTLILACIGLYGLIAFNITRRMKEFSVRKVLGASLKHITLLINKDYIWILTIAFVIGAPVGFMMMDQLITSIYPDSPPVTAWPFVLALGVMVLSLGLTIFSQVFKVAKNNPADTLKGD